MREEAEIMDEIHGLDGDLKSFDPQAHWFCPRRNDDDPVDYDNPDEEEDMSFETKKELIADWKSRQAVAYKYSLILGLGAEISGRLLDAYTKRLNELLTSCDKCVHNWHLGRKAYLKELSGDSQFDEYIVAALSSRLDRLDFERLDRGLAIAEELLRKAEPAQRNQALLAKHDTSALLALYEALCCINYHSDDDRLAKHFDYVFEQAQGKKVLRIGDILPAMARFLFSRNPVRQKFATYAWMKMNATLTEPIFEWVIHDVLEQAIILVSHPHADPEDILRFWAGFLSILEKMNENMIREWLRAMQVQPDVYRLALQHLASSSERIVGLVVNALRKLLIKAPKDFWEALGTISAHTVVDLIFQSPGFEKMLNNPESWDVFEHSLAVSWIPVLLRSIGPDSQYEACRKLLDTLFFKFQNERKFAEETRLACCRAGLEALHVTLQTFITPDYKVDASHSLITISNVMGLVHHFRDTIIGCADLDLNTDLATPSELKEVGMLDIKDALALDCKAIGAEYYALDNGRKLQRGNRTDSQEIWQAVLDIFRPGNLELVKSILPALIPLTGVDILRPEDKRHPERLPKDHQAFNKDLRELFDNIAKVLERLSDFSSRHLYRLMEDNATARTLIASLISADEGISGAAVEIIKVMTDQESKSDAFENLLSTHLAQTLTYMTSAIKRVSNSKTFGPVPHMIKSNRDILRGLCGTTGVLRSRSMFQQEEKSAVLGWWIMLWHALDVVFSQAEAWAPRVDQSTTYMQNFLRDCMEFAESLFDNHSIIASVLRESSSSEFDSESEESTSEKAGNKKVLEVICRNINGLVRMIRLRDAYLISVITSLIGKLLRCLGEYDIEVTQFASSYIRDSCKREADRGFIRTNLTSQQKAELQRALDENVGIDFVEVSKPTASKKQGTIESWTKSADGQQHEPKLPTKKAVPGSKAINRHVEKHLEMVKAREAMNAQQKEQFMSNRKRDAEETQKRKEEAIAKARALRGPSAIIKGEGSGLKDIGGVAGKDHAPARNEIMVGSSDEESDEDDDEDETNALVKRRKETSKKVTEYEESKRRAFQLAQQGPVKKTKIQRSAKDQRARVDPDMTKLYLEILNWDIFHPGDAPPGENQCRKIDNKYQDLDLYKRTFGPLLISEVWRSLVTAKDENNYKAVEVKVLNRVSVDKFLEVSTTMPIAYNKDLKMSERDIVLFSKDSDPLNSPQAPHCLARVDRTTRKKDAIEITYRISRDVDPTFLPSFVPNGKVFALKICDMTTTQREFAALSSLEYYDLCTEVLEAKPSPLLKYPEEKISTISSKYSLNRGQAKAILSANDNDGFTLIQGPPGSGKTKTIVAMVGALLTPTLQQQQADQARVRAPTNGQPAKAPPPKKKLLICAPSNAAVDELVVRLKEGIQPLNGPRQKINVIRIGRSDAINAAVKDVMLDELVRIKLEGDDSDKNKLLQARDSLHKEAAQVKERLNVIRPQMDEAQKDDNPTKIQNLRREFDQLKRRQAQLGSKIDEDKESGMTVSRQNEISRRKFQQEIIDGAHVICSTLSGSGHDMFKNLDVDFETVIIDEAAQCIELSALIPLKYGCSKCILVGDPEQLPPTVLSRSAQSFGYEQSLFVRMQKNHPNNIHLLDTQYRMHPEISRFPSAQFYNSRLVDGDGMAQLRQQPWHASTILGPYRFFDVAGFQTKQAQGHSFINVPELNAALQLYQRLKTDYSQVDFRGKIGIITSYKAQLNELKARFAQRYTDAIFDEIEFNTTDAFQGREREIIIFSCVRAKATGGIGFLGDIRRMNVGLTRAKSSLWVLGDSRALQQGSFWNELILDAQKRGRYTSENVMELFSRPTERNQGPVQAEPPLLPANSLPSRTMSTSSASGSNGTSFRPKAEDNEVEMIDAPGPSESRKSSSSSTATGPKARNLLGISNVKRPTVKQEPRLDLADASSTASNELNTFGKRNRDESPGPEKVAKDPKAVDLDAALRAQQAKAAAQTARPPRPPGVAPPRKRPAADPFIKRKPPPKR